MTTIIITGTDTDVGKTVFAAGLTRFLDGYYWKPVQAGDEGGTDGEIVRHLSGLPDERILPEVYKLKRAASPHDAAASEGVVIDPVRLVLPQTDRPLIVEGAGGLMVPLTRSHLFIDTFARWKAPVVLCARTTLGTINHTLLSLEALRTRRIPVLGVAFIGDENRETEQTICAMGQVKRLGGLPHLTSLSPHSLEEAFKAAFVRSEFIA